MRPPLSPEHKILHSNFVRFGANAKEWMRKCVVLLPKIEKYRIWEQKGFDSIHEYAAKLAGMSRNTVDDALRILRRIEDKPELQKVVMEKGLNAVRPVASIATRETEKFWAEKALQMSKHTLEVYVKEISHDRRLAGDVTGIPRTGTENNDEKPQQKAIFDFGVEECSPSNGIAKPRKTIVMQLDSDIADQMEKLKSPGDWNQLMRELLKIRAAHVEEQKPKTVQTLSRHIPTKIQRYVVTKTNGTCSYPRCTRPHEILHHTRRFALEKSHNPDHLEPLCKAHERLAHCGLIAQENLPADQWQVRAQPDKNIPTYDVDRLVARYRTPG